MIFKETNRVIYCRDEYYKNFDNYRFFININRNAIDVIINKKEYYRGYMIHREDGPATQLNDGYKEWHLNGIRYTKKEFEEIMSLKKKREILNDI